MTTGPRLPDRPQPGVFRLLPMAALFLIVVGALLIVFLRSLPAAVLANILLLIAVGLTIVWRRRFSSSFDASSSQARVGRITSTVGLLIQLVGALSASFWVIVFGGVLFATGLLWVYFTNR